MTDVEDSLSKVDKPLAIDDLERSQIQQAQLGQGSTHLGAIKRRGRRRRQRPSHATLVTARALVGLDAVGTLLRVRCHDREARPTRNVVPDALLVRRDYMQAGRVRNLEELAPDVGPGVDGNELVDVLTGFVEHALDRLGFFDCGDG